MMNRLLQRWLDGEMGPEELPPRERVRARRWRRLLEELRWRVPGRAPPGLATRVMARIRAEPSRDRPGDR